MSTSAKWGILALLEQRRGYAYELVKRWEKAFPWWELSESGLYRALHRLADDGMVLALSEQRHEISVLEHRTPFEITDKGRAALREFFLRAERDEPSPRNMLMRLSVACGDRGSLNVVLNDMEQETLRQQEGLAVVAEIAGLDDLARWAEVRHRQLAADARLRLLQDLRDVARGAADAASDETEDGRRGRGVRGAAGA